jgi:hypothetical protein
MPEYLLCVPVTAEVLLETHSNDNISQAENDLPLLLFPVAIGSSNDANIDLNGSI